MKEKKRILIVDDYEPNLDSAFMLEDEGYHVDTVTTFADAAKLLGYTEPVGEFKCIYREPDEDKANYFAALLDLNFPLGGTYNENPTSDFLKCDGHRDEPQALGVMLALYAAERKVPYIGILTDGGHHAGPIAATFQLFYKGTCYLNSQKKPGMISSVRLSDSKFMMFQTPDFPLIYLLNDGTMTDVRPYTTDFAPYKVSDEEYKRYMHTFFRSYIKTIKGDYIANTFECEITKKNWKAVLERLLLED
jgi:CheY-like chemotaxis protein